MVLFPAASTLTLTSAAVWFNFMAGLSDGSSNNCDIESVLGNGGAGLEVYVEGDSGYDDAAYQFGSMVVDFADKINPTMIAYAKNVSDVQRVIEFVANCDEIDTITIRSGGHQYSGASSCDSGRCLQLDLHDLNIFETLDENYVDPNDTSALSQYDAALVKVGTGMSLMELYPQAYEKGYLILSGLCAQVNVGGNYQSSAHGLFGHSLGSGMDWIKEIDVVLANGSLITVSESNNYANLFWAIRGGSPGAFGVIVSYTIKVLYSDNFPHSGLSYTYYRFGNDDENDEKALTRLSALYSEATASSAFTDSLDIGSINGGLFPIEDLEGSNVDSQLIETLHEYGSTHLLFAAIVYLGRESDVPLNESVAYEEIVEGLFRNTSRLVQEPIGYIDADVPAGAIPLAGLVDYTNYPMARSNIFSNEYFNQNVHETLGKRVTQLVNDHGYDVVVAFQGGVYGGQFFSNDPDRVHTAHAYRDTVSFFDFEVRLRNHSISIENDAIEELQDELDDMVFNIGLYVPAEDRNKIWLPYSHGSGSVSHMHGDDVNNIDDVWQNYYDNGLKLYNKLRCTKYIVDPNNLFKSSLTVSPKECSPEDRKEFGGDVDIDDEKEEEEPCSINEKLKSALNTFLNSLISKDSPF